MEEQLEALYEKMGVSRKVLNLSMEVEASLKDRFQQIDKVTQYNQMKVLNAMQKNKLSEAHFSPTTGYGYNDIGRETLEKVYADIFHTEKALVRSQITCGTHALYLALSAILRPGDELISPVGKPYDTMEEIIGIRKSTGSLAEYGISYKQVELLDDGSFDYEGIKNAISKNTRMMTIQRSKGYLTRPTFSVKQIGGLISFIKDINPEIICMVDNCYGEFVDIIEPSDVGADMVVGSLIKNPGGGLAPICGYICGTTECINKAYYRLTAPGLGSEVGATLGVNREFFQGLFQAPQVVNGALKGAIFAANLYQKLGFDCTPNATEQRHDIIQAITFNDPKKVIAFCEGIQYAAPVDSYVTPTPWAMPGYDCDVIMAAGAFISGASIELSADAPMHEPYTVYFQGGLSYDHARFGIMKSLARMEKKGLLDI